MDIKQMLKTRFLLLKSPKDGFAQFEKITFETVVREYLQLLIFASIIAGLLTFLIRIAQSSYYHLFLKAKVNFLNAINYSLGQASGTLLFYFFIGTFIIFFISLVLNPFFKIKYVNILKGLLLSLTPLLLFGWILFLIPGLIIWSIYLATTFFNMQKNSFKINKKSIEQRD